MADVLVAELSAAALQQLPAAIGRLIPAELSAFFAVLELAYLAASADGLDDSERDVLSSILEQATGAKIDRASFDAHFEDLDQTVEALGRRERLARTAADFETGEAKVAAIKFAALVAMGDGKLHADELAVLTEVGALLELPAGAVRGYVDEAVRAAQGGAA